MRPRYAVTQFSQPRSGCRSSATLVFVRDIRLTQQRVLFRHLSAVQASTLTLVQHLDLTFPFASQDTMRAFSTFVPLTFAILLPPHLVRGQWDAQGFRTDLSCRSVVDVADNSTLNVVIQAACHLKSYNWDVSDFE